jgi:hypothetical protein
MGSIDEPSVETSQSAFAMTCAVVTEIAAPVQRVWALLTDARGMTRWNSTLTSIEGPIELGGTIVMQVAEAPGMSFKPKVVRFEANRAMEWRQGTPGMFLGIRTYEVTAGPDASTTRFEMTERFSGLLLPMIGRRLPEFGPIFRRYAADLKAEAERAA